MEGERRDWKGIAGAMELIAGAAADVGMRPLMAAMKARPPSGIGAERRMLSSDFTWTEELRHITNVSLLLIQVTYPQLSAGNRAGPGQPSSSPSCFVPNRFGPIKPKRFLSRAVLARSVKTVAQSGPKPRRAFFGPCRPKPGPFI
jgi:hypothetical protein